MEPPPLPAPSSIASRFSSETSLNEAKATRTAEWEAMYHKLGQEPPPRDEEPAVYDGRSLWEKLQEHKDKKQEAFDEQIKFKNQFRALDEDEISFLDSLVDDNTEEEIVKAQQIKEELKSFRQAVISRQALPPPPVSKSSSIAATSSLPISSSIATTTNTTQKKVVSKKKKTLPGVIVKKKAEISKVPKEKRKVSSSNNPEEEGESNEIEIEIKKRKIELKEVEKI